MSGKEKEQDWGEEDQDYCRLELVLTPGSQEDPPVTEDMLRELIDELAETEEVMNISPR